MEARGRLLLSLFVLVLVFGLLGGAALAGEAVTAGNRMALADVEEKALAAQVQALKLINRLNLSTDQMSVLKSVLETLMTAVEESRGKIVDLLAEEKSVLLAPEVDRERVNEIEKLMGVATQEMALAWQSARLEISKILNAEQLKMLGALVEGSKPVAPQGSKSMPNIRIRGGLEGDVRAQIERLRESGKLPSGFRVHIEGPGVFDGRPGSVVLGKGEYPVLSGVFRGGGQLKAVKLFLSVLTEKLDAVSPSIS